MIAELPPGPRAPAFIQGLQWIFSPIPFMERCAKRYGAWFTVDFPRRFKFVFTSDPKAIKDIFTGDSSKLHAGKLNFILKPLLRAHSILLLDGPDHIRARRMMLPSFHADRMQSYGLLMSEVAEKAMRRWVADRPLLMQSEMQEITLEVILRAVFGLEEEGKLSRMKSLLIRILALTANPIGLMLVDGRGEVRFSRLHEALPWISDWGRVLRLRKEMDEILLSEIARKKRDPALLKEDILSLLIQAKDEQGRPMTDEELRDEMFTLLVAGHETSATALSWTLYHLAANPQIQDRLAAEVRSAGPDPKRVWDLPYLDAVVKEALRLNPVIPLVGRFLEEPARIGDRDFPAGVCVTPCIYLTHRRPDLWPEPERFDPQRFLDKPANNYEFFPFGGGVRRCIGMAFALAEIKTVVAAALRRKRFETPPGYVARIERRAITFAPSQGAPLVVRN